MVNFTESAVKSSPLWNFTPRRSLSSHVFGFRFFTDSARSGLSSMVCGSRVRSPSPISPMIEPLSTERNWCGSIVSGVDGKPMVSVGFRLPAPGRDGLRGEGGRRPAYLNRSRRVGMCPPGSLGKAVRCSRLLRQLGEELQHRAIEGLGLVAVAEVPRRARGRSARARSSGASRASAERRVLVAADEECRRGDARELIGDVVHLQQRAQRVRVPDRRQRCGSTRRPPRARSDRAGAARRRWDWTRWRTRPWRPSRPRASP